MTDKKFKKIDEEEYGAYWIIDISNCVKTKEDFLEDDIYDIYGWEDYLKECGNVLSSKNVVKLLNELHEENQDLKAFNQDLSEELSVCANARISKDARIERLEEKIQRERTSFMKTHERWSKEAETKIKELSEENEQLKNDVYDWKASAEDYLKLGKSLKKENEQLKQQLQSILKLTKKIEDCTHDIKLIGDVE